ncbi:biotin--[acetyl-CoA-carboxylase] ligase [Paraburkholderia silvatlantica]|uniref:biotin--[biotin carboxyl-carrier protein] ligase n=1 Tax=Paraburkholderia silvatlantica TaxID=321895 RepID=A0ABR6FIP9_9BURK|nr:biotin--[acetyl-CoA-carboxylase] ligase [Paraburkholderia silvatlantica]MBB2927305.1 BirA family biotin operon repressor/biotin-[acetyl-CoA-carboxylase] ligase [Paraburkholderia silvatlantica]PVY37022.1 BirA family biotin operon repressor/biotin-[acetyl-CoA-carboxylase] ligase [Paraburkholderia silvatlantica]PXW41700.1 BirA family biotin operon repressor/biotin-[acetyl-CoA-carboxylase] ligase [Paraburkholderia silvatlantica]
MNATPPTPATPSAGDWRIDRNRAITLFGPAAHDWPIEIVEETGSTNADLMVRLKALPQKRDALARPIVRVAYLQTAGRGRRGRTWVAQPGDALLFSIGCVLPRPIEGLAGLSLAVGSALVDGLRTLPVAAPGQIALKWPNDVLLEGDKLAGILVETAWTAADATAVVIGIGTNVRGEDALAARVEALNAAAGSAAVVPGTTPTALSRAWANANLTDTLAAELNALEAALQRFGAAGFAPFQARWNACHAYAGREVAIYEQGRELQRGTAAGVDERGQLLVDTPGGRETVTAGDVSLRLADSGA